MESNRRIWPSPIPYRREKRRLFVAVSSAALAAGALGFCVGLGYIAISTQPNLPAAAGSAFFAAISAFFTFASVGAYKDALHRLEFHNITFLSLTRELEAAKSDAARAHWQAIATRALLSEGEAGGAKRGASAPPATSIPFEGEVH